MKLQEYAEILLEAFSINCFDVVRVRLIANKLYFYSALD